MKTSGRERNTLMWFHLYVESINKTKTDSQKQRPGGKGWGMGKNGKKNIVDNIFISLHGDR